MQAPTATDVQGWTELDLLKNADAAKASRIVAVAEALFLRITGQTWDSIATADEPLVQQAVKGLSELTAYQDSPEYLETLSDFDLISSFSAGPYSESRRSPEDARKARMLVAWPWLSDLLWNLLTPDQYNYWTEFFLDTPPPAFEVTEVNWGADFYDLGYYWGA
jgi:hypothetical protein